MVVVVVVVAVEEADLFVCGGRFGTEADWPSAALFPPRLRFPGRRLLTFRSSSMEGGGEDETTCRAVAGGR